ncbi:MAG: substrate-binding domain-containing protein [Lentisphaeria bacterium]|nr:substrate-binding domain-containing protein [Lentisphaeria bacterium]
MSKYLEVAEILKSRVMHGDYLSSPMPGERKLAEEIGVSYMTARKALKHLIDTGVVAKDEDGKAQLPKSKAKYGSCAFLAPAFVSMLTIRWQTTLDRTLSRGGRILRSVYFMHWNDPTITDTLANFDLIFLLPKLEPPPEHLLRKLRECGKPVVVLETDWSERGFLSILSSPVESLGKLLEHLAETGDRVDCFNTQPLDEVIDGWLGVWEEFPVRGRRLNYPVDFYDDTLAHAVKVAASLLRSGEWKPKAVLCTTFSAAIGLSRVLHDFGFEVGRDVRLAAVNDVGWAAYLTPSITTLENADLDLLTGEALELLRDDPGTVRCLKPGCQTIQYGESSRIRA